MTGVLADRLDQALEFGEAEGIIISTPAQTKSNREIAHGLAEHQLAMAEQGVKIAAIVMLHNACERLLWRPVRFGLVGNREQAIKWIAKRNVTVETLINEGVDAPVLRRQKDSSARRVKSKPIRPLSHWMHASA